MIHPIHSVTYRYLFDAYQRLMSNNEDERDRVGECMIIYVNAPSFHHISCPLHHVSHPFLSISTHFIHFEVEESQTGTAMNENAVSVPLMHQEKMPAMWDTNWTLGY